MVGTMEILWIRLFRSDKRSLDHFFFWEACSCFSVSLFLCSRWNSPVRCWQSQMKLKVSWIASFDMLSSLYSMSFPWGVSLPFGHVRFTLRNWAKLRFHGTTSQFQNIRLSSDFQSYPRKWHCHFESSTICHVYPSYPQQDRFHYGFYQFKGLHLSFWRNSSLQKFEHFHIRGTPLHVQPALLKLDLNPIHPAFHNHSFPSGIHHDSGPQEISTLISWVSAEISTASPFCKAGIFVSSSWVLHKMMCSMCPWVRNCLGWNILGSKAQIFQISTDASSHEANQPEPKGCCYFSHSPNFQPNSSVSCQRRNARVSGLSGLSPCTAVTTKGKAKAARLDHTQP